MKKLLLAAMLLFASYGVFADDLDQFVQNLRPGLSKQGIELRPFKAERIVFLDSKIQHKLSEFDQTQLDFFNTQIALIKQNTINEFKKNPAIVNLIKNDRITFIYNFIFIDQKVLSLIIVPEDFQ